VTDLDKKFEELTIDDFHTALRQGEMTSAELVDWYLARIEAHNNAGAEIQAVVTVNPHAHDDAAARDEFFATNGRLSGPLHGVPVLVKDQAETAGLRTTFGSKHFEHYVPEADATVIARLKNAGAVILAKTAMCDFAADWFSSSSMTDHTKNPYRSAREPGESSAGTGAGVAANLGLVGIGEDTGGSIRIPASFNNLQQPFRSACHQRADQPRWFLTTRALPRPAGADGPDRRGCRETARLHRRLRSQRRLHRHRIGGARHRRPRQRARRRRSAVRLADRGAGARLRF
jgi:hypothetical protein